MLGCFLSLLQLALLAFLFGDLVALGWVLERLGVDGFDRWSWGRRWGLHLAISLVCIALMVFIERRLKSHEESPEDTQELERFAAMYGVPGAVCRDALQKGFALQDVGEALEFRHTHPPAIAREVLERDVLRRPMPPEVTGQPAPEGAVSFAIPKAFLAEGE